MNVVHCDLVYPKAPQVSFPCGALFYFAVLQYFQRMTDLSTKSDVRAFLEGLQRLLDSERDALAATPYDDPARPIRERTILMVEHQMAVAQDRLDELPD